MCAMEERGGFVEVVESEPLLIFKTELPRRSSTCMRTLTKSNGYSKITEADPPTIPAVREARRVLDLTVCCCCW